MALGALALGLMVDAAASAAPVPAARTVAVGAPNAGSRPAATSPARSIPATAADQAALAQAYVSARHLPLGAVSSIRPGSLHLASAPATRMNWAIADFTPSPAAGARVRAGFQDGASTGVFSQAARQAWHLVQAGGPQRCGRAVPAPIRAAWHLPAQAGCQATASSERRAAANALSMAGSTYAAGQSIADIALSQVGVSDTPAVTNYNGVDCDPYSTLVGASTPNADGCGFDQNLNVQNENEEWCSDFAKWVWQRAGITTDMNVINAGAVSFYNWGLGQGEPMRPDSGTPAAGDAVVFFPPGPITSSYADHVGIVSGVNPDGTVNLVDGDFPGASNISVQYNTDLSLTTWASQAWSHGEQWILVTPPTTRQQPVPSAGITGPRVAVAGTTADLTAWAAQRGGSVTQRLWTFGDGSAANASGPDASHVFARAGCYTVTMSATSSLGTASTRTWNVDVIAASSAVASTPSTAVWYSATPVNQLLFLATGTGGLATGTGELAAESSDGSRWLRQAIPGQTGAGSGLTALDYPDMTDSMTQHVYFRAADGSLAETYLSGAAWVTHALAGQPASGSAIVATTTTAPPAGSRPAGSGPAAGDGPAVFYFNAAGQLTESYEQDSAWATRTLPGPPATGPRSLALTDVTAGGQAGERLFYLASHGALMVTSSAGSGWQDSRIRSGFGVAADSPLSAVTTGPDGDEQRVFFVDRRGRLAEAISGPPGGGWAVRELPGTPAPTASPIPALSLTATNYLLPSGALAEEVFYLSASGQPGVTSWNSREWQTASLPGVATAILDADGYPAAGQPEQLFLADGPALRLDASDTAGRVWTAAVLPNTAATRGSARRP